MVFFGIAFYCSVWILLAVALIQTTFKLTTGRPLFYLIDLGHNLGEYIRQIVLYETFSSNILPWPFSAWPNKATVDDESAAYPD